MLEAILEQIIEPGLALLPPALNGDDASVLLLATGLQESRFCYRRELGGYGLGYWKLHADKVARVFAHAGCREPLERLCEAVGVECTPRAVHAALEYNDQLATAITRLLLHTATRRLPAQAHPEQAWLLYLQLWKPALPRHLSWTPLHRNACNALQVYRALPQPA